MRDKHLRSPDFFDTDNHPDITVEVTGPQSATLTIRGTTLPLPLPLHTTIARVDAGTVRVPSAPRSTAPNGGSAATWPG